MIFFSRDLFPPPGYQKIFLTEQEAYSGSKRRFSADLYSDSITSPHNYYFAGGPESAFTRSIPLAGFHSGEIAVDRFAGLRFDVDFEFHKDLHLGLIMNVAIAREPDNINELTFLGGYGLGVGYMSIIGPMKLD